jgi:fructose-bisphosphate aldolase class 1
MEHHEGSRCEKVTAPLLQASGLVPIVEPEVLLDGDHGIDRTLEVAEQIWAETFKYMADNKVMFEGILLKPSMVGHCLNFETIEDLFLS